MTNSTNDQDPIGSAPNFRFKVDFGNEMKEIPFQRVSGLETENNLTEYQKGSDPVFSRVKMPVLTKAGDINLRQGIFANDDKFRNWRQEIRMNTINKSTVLIKLLDDTGKVVMQWTLNNAWPTKISSADLSSEGNEIAVESVEIAYETLIVSNQ